MLVAKITTVGAGVAAFLPTIANGIPEGVVIRIARCGSADVVGPVIVAIKSRVTQYVLICFVPDYQAW